jgi:CHASE1-domain containing sensor protein
LLVSSREKPTHTPWLAFVLCLLLTAAASLHVAQGERNAERVQLAIAATSVRDHIVERMESYVAVLRSAAGLFSIHEVVTADDFRSFFDELDVRKHYPGTQGIGYTARFGAVSVPEATARAHAQRWTNVNVWPDTPRDEVHAIVLLEPLDARNRAALGFDMRTERTRREAMDRARDEGDVALSGKVTLVQELEEKRKQAGFLLYSPVFAGGTVPTSPDERRAKLKGYAFAPLRAGDLLEGIFDGTRQPVSFELYDGDAVAEASWLYGSGASGERADEVSIDRLSIAGRTWTLRFVRPPGAPASASLVLVVAGLGTVLSVLVLLVTVAREKALAREVRARASATASEEMLRLEKMLIGIVGHDLRSPLNAIALSTDALLAKPMEPRATASLRRIRASADRMTRMIEDVVDLTRMRLGGGIVLTPAPIELGPLVHDAVDEVVRGAPECRVEVRTCGGLRGSWDADRLSQAFSNLLGNAARYSLGADVVVTLDGTAPECVVAKVHNAGVIAPSLLPVVFEPFRGDEARRETRGLGLGLYITRAVVEAHGGRIDVTSSEGAGTTFTTTLPR